MASRGQQVAATGTNHLHNIFTRTRSHQFQDTTLRDWDDLDDLHELDLPIYDIKLARTDPSDHSLDEDIDFLDDLMLGGIPKLKYKLASSSAKHYHAKKKTSRHNTVRPVLAHEDYDLNAMIVARFPSFLPKSASSPKQHEHAAAISTREKKQDDFDLFDDIIAEEFPKSKANQSRKN